MIAKSRIYSVMTLGVCLLILSSSAFTQTGRITGTVVEKGTQSGLIGANVSIVGTNIGAATDNQGQFLIGNVPPGTYQIVARYIGYETAEQSVQVQVNRVATVDFELTTSVL